MVIEFLFGWISNQELGISSLTIVLGYPELNFPQHLKTARFDEKDVVCLIILSNDQGVSLKLPILKPLRKLN